MVLISLFSLITQARSGLYNVPRDSLDHFLASLDDHLRGELLTFIWPDRVAELLVLADKIQPTLRLDSENGDGVRNDYRNAYVPDTWKHACRIFDLDIVKANKTYRHMRNFIFCTSFTYKGSLGIEKLYLDFFHDQKRAGKYHISQEGYARIALQCIKYVCGEPHE